MKTARRLSNVFLLALILLSCKKDYIPSKLCRKPAEKVKYTVCPVNRLGSNVKDIFLMNQTLFALDSCFGNVTPQTFRKAEDYLISKGNNNRPFIKICISKIIANDTIRIWEVRDEYKTEAQLSLQYSLPLTHKAKGESYLKITRTDTINRTAYSLTFEMSGMKWALNGKERIRKENDKNEYCYDTINKELKIQFDDAVPSENEINFFQSFVYTEDSHWICK
ncbi:MAG: hypothetical protein EOO51_14890 [Flavobacterium sp.]|nr:MAG: hypothetical protein EOO51_14890 [Flavobacterium sp.]